MTNADKIRQMSDEELLRRLNYSCLCNDERTLNDCEKHNGKCTDCLLDWLREEANDEKMGGAP